MFVYLYLSSLKLPGKKIGHSQLHLTRNTRTRGEPIRLKAADIKLIKMNMFQINEQIKWLNDFNAKE